MFKKILIPALAAILLAGCSSKKAVVDPLPVMNPTAGGAAAEDSALEMNQIRKDYDNCIQKYGLKNPNCQELEWTYEDAKAHYDAAATKPRR